MQYSFASPGEAIPKATAALKEALEVDSTRAEVYYSLAQIKTYMEWDWKVAELSFKKCIELNPNYAQGHVGYSSLLTIVVRKKEIGCIYRISGGFCHFIAFIKAGRNETHS